jgi:two-component sensor histidine kinase
LQIETKRQEIRDKRNKQKEEEISRTQEAEHKKKEPLQFIVFLTQTTARRLGSME